MCASNNQQTNAMGVTSYSWGPAVQQEANKQWFYAIATSIIWSLYQLLQLSVASIPDKSRKNKHSEKSSEAKAESHTGDTTARSQIVLQLIVDCCDLVIPAAALQWVAVDPAMVGVCGTVSTVLAGHEIWKQVQSPT